MATKKITVNAGDTFRSIAQREYGDPSKYKEVMQNNRSRLKAGSSIEIPDLTIKPGQPALATPLATPTAPNASQFAEMNKNASTIGAQAGQQAVQQVNTPATPTAPIAPTPTAPTPPLEFGTNVPQYAPVSTANNPQGIGAPNIGRPYYQGGKQTFDIFDKMKQGIISPTQTPVTPAEKEAVSMYQNYQKYQSADAQTLLGAIESGELTPDPTNLLWRALGENGQPTDAMIQAYAMWDKGIKAGANGKRSQDPFLGGDWQKIQTAEDANAMINDFSGEDDTVDGEVVSSTDGVSSSTGVVKQGTSEYDMYRQTVIEMMGQQPTGGTDYQGKLNELRTRYNVQQDEMGLQSLDDEAMAIENDLIARRNQARSQPVAMGVIAGRVGEIERQQMERLNQVNRDRQYLANSLAQKQSIIGSMLDAYGADYESAVADFDKRYNRSMQAIDMFRSIRKDEVAEQSALASAELAQKKFEEEKIQQRKDDANAKLNVIYNAIQEGTMNPEVLAKPAMALQVAQMEIQAGMPIGTFAGLMSKHPEKKLESTKESVNAKGEKILSFIMTDRNGTPTVIQQNLGVDAKALQEIQKGVYDIAKAKNESEMFPIEKQLKQQQLMNSILTGQKSYVDIAKDMQATPSNYINPAKSAYNVAVATDGSLILNLQKNDKGEYKTIPGREQCGEFVNDALGLEGSNRMPDSFEGKAKLATQQTADVGSAFVQKLTGKYAQYGHTGIVTKAYPDGSFDYVNANEAGKNDGAITTGHMTAEEAKNKGVVGFTPGYKNVLNSSSSSTSKMTEGERKEQGAQALRSQASTDLQGMAGSDGYVSPAVYRELKKDWVDKTGDGKQFDDLYKTYINPSHWQDYGVDSQDEKMTQFFESESQYQSKQEMQGVGEKYAGIALKAGAEVAPKLAELKKKYANISNKELERLYTKGRFGYTTRGMTNEQPLTDAELQAIEYEIDRRKKAGTM